ncbi:hypothetical protein FS749_006868 [Ceratobasidium sp. UAMH 11750]|nr:hypothetical protein FS749_006868 [Ceratobasidium sp. UAMH 11750]
MAEDPCPIRYWDHLQEQDPHFKPESKITLEAERGIPKKTRRYRALHDFSIWEKGRLVGISPYIAGSQLQKLTIYASVASLNGPAKYLVAFGEWETDYGRMEKRSLRLKGVRSATLEKYEGFRGGKPWICLHTAGCSYFLLEPAVAQAEVWSQMVQSWAGFSGCPVTELVYRDVDCNAPRPDAWLGLCSWKGWRFWCKTAAGRTVIPGNEGCRPTDRQDDIDPRGVSQDPDHSYDEKDEYATEDDAEGEIEQAGQGDTHAALVRRPKGEQESAKSRGKRKVGDGAERTRLSRKRKASPESSASEKVEVSEASEGEQGSAGPLPSGDEEAQVEKQLREPGEDQGLQKRARIAIEGLVNPLSSAEQHLAFVDETSFAQPPPAGQASVQPESRLEQPVAATCLPGLHTIVRPGGSSSAFVPPTATTITPFNPFVPPASSAKSLSESLADMAQEIHAPGSQLQLLAQLFSQPTGTVFKPPVQAMRPRTPLASQSSSGSAFDPPLDEEVVDPADGDWFASQADAVGLNLDFSSLWTDDPGDQGAQAPDLNFNLQEDMYWQDMQPGGQLSPQQFSH